MCIKSLEINILIEGGEEPLRSGTEVSDTGWHWNHPRRPDFNDHSDLEKQPRPFLPPYTLLFSCNPTLPFISIKVFILYMLNDLRLLYFFKQICSPLFVDKQYSRWKKLPFPQNPRESFSLWQVPKMGHTARICVWTNIFSNCFSLLIISMNFHINEKKIIVLTIKVEDLG
jgi:hypothetical protein